MGCDHRQQKQHFTIAIITFRLCDHADLLTDTTNMHCHKPKIRLRSKQLEKNMKVFPSVALKCNLDQLCWNCGDAKTKFWLDQQSRRGSLCPISMLVHPSPSTNFLCGYAENWVMLLMQVKALGRKQQKGRTVLTHHYF